MYMFPNIGFKDKISKYNSNSVNTMNPVRIHLFPSESLNIFRQACRKGDLVEVIQIYNKRKLSDLELCLGFSDSCQHGNLQVCQWLHFKIGDFLALRHNIHYMEYCVKSNNQKLIDWIQGLNNIKD